nr:MAG TPA: hypothetical protein [Caudoviricetes sp.]
MDTRGRGMIPRPFHSMQKRPSLLGGMAFCCSRGLSPAAEAEVVRGLFYVGCELKEPSPPECPGDAARQKQTKKAGQASDRRFAGAVCHTVPFRHHAAPATASPIRQFLGQARPLAREQIEVVAQASGAVEQGLAQGKIVRAAFAAQLPFPGLGSLCGIALVPGLDFLIVGRAFSLFLDGQSVQFSFFPQVQLAVQLAAAVDLRPRGPGLCPLLADQQGRFLPFAHRRIVTVGPGLPGFFLGHAGILFRHLRIAPGHVGGEFRLFALLFLTAHGTPGAHGGAGKGHGGPQQGRGTAGHGHQRSSLCQTLSVWRAPRRRYRASQGREDGELYWITSAPRSLSPASAVCNSRRTVRPLRAAGARYSPSRAARRLP